jgi:ABC-type multidrug transport system fused ATPase/permease subunit
MHLRKRLLAHTWAQLFLVLVIVVLANLWSASTFTRIDLTREGVYSLDLTTRALMLQLDKPLLAKVYFTKGLQAPYNNHEQALVDKLEDLRAYSNGLMEIEVTDPTNVRELEAEARRFGIEPIQYRYQSTNVTEMKKVFMGVALVYGDRQEVLPAVTRVETLEYELARAVKRISADEGPRTVGWTLSNGEPNLLTGSGPLERIRNAISAEYNIQGVQLDGPEGIPEEVDALFVVGPQKPLSERSLYELDQFLMRGGSLAVFVLLFLGGPMAIEGSLSVGQIAAFVALLGILLPPLRSMGWMLSVFQRGQVSLERILELFDAPTDRPEGDAPVALAPGPPALSLRDLRFAYPDDPEDDVLKGVSVDVPAGAVVGVFGRTGSGKSTLLRVLARLYNPPRGTVFVGPDNTDITAIDLDRWRERLSVAPQRPFLFSDTIGENVELSARPDREPPEGVAVSGAARDRAVDLAALGVDLEALPEGIDTVVGERGIMLSGGQRQRVALARALYTGGGLLLLDDVLSAVDHSTEARLVGSLVNIGDGGQRPTTFIVSHRVSAFRGADLILVLDDGRLVDSGTHAELAQRPGLYRETWLAQRPSGSEAP